jgi:uncharacterized protein (UPF0254 family)
MADVKTEDIAAEIEKKAVDYKEVEGAKVARMMLESSCECTGGNAGSGSGTGACKCPHGAVS